MGAKERTKSVGSGSFSRHGREKIMTGSQLSDNNECAVCSDEESLGNDTYNSDSLGVKARELMKSKVGRRTGSILLPQGKKVRAERISSASKHGSTVIENIKEKNSSGNDLHSQVSKKYRGTEKDVCFPMAPEHVKVGDFDIDRLEEFIESERTENQRIVKREAEIRIKSGGSKNSTFARKYTPETPNQSGSSIDSCSSSDDNVPKLFTGDEFFNGLVGNDSMPPNRFSFFNTERKATIHSPELSNLVEPEKGVQNLFLPEDSVWWLDCTCPTEGEMKVLAKTFGIHPLTAEDIRTQEAREKVELFNTYYFVCFHSFEDDSESEDFLERINVYMVVFRQGILTVHFSPIESPVNVRRRVRQLRSYFAVTSDWLCYALIDDITDGFAPVITSIEYEAEAIEDSVFLLREKDFKAMLFRIGESRRKVMTVMRLLQGKADVIKQFAKRCRDQNSHPSVTSSQPVKPRTDIALYLGDIQDHLITMFQSLMSYEKILSRAHMNYLAQLQLQSFYFNNSVTDMLSKVTFLGTILVPMNLITHLFGMNVPVPGGSSTGYSWFGGILGVILFICVASALLGEWYLWSLGRKGNTQSSNSIHSFKVGRHKKEPTVLEKKTINSLPSKLSRYGDLI